MAGLGDALASGCMSNSDYAVICSFFEQFGDKSGLLFPSFQDLQQMIDNNSEAPYPLIELHVKLLRKLKKTVSFDRWEKAAAKFACSYSQQDCWEIERFGYAKISVETKLKLLKNLLEAQFDGNLKFKSEINKVESDELRLQPLGRDLQGRRYWHLLDDECNLRVYREDLDEETWELVSSDKQTMVKLIEQLTSGKESSEDEERSAETSEESNTNSREGFNETKAKLEEPLDGPSESKRFKSDLEAGCVKSVEQVVSSETNNNSAESEVGEAIESPVLLVRGAGNGADCETGNPACGSGDSESSADVRKPSEQCSSASVNGQTSTASVSDKMESTISNLKKDDVPTSRGGAGNTNVKPVVTALSLLAQYPDSSCSEGEESGDDRSETKDANTEPIDDIKDTGVGETGSVADREASSNCATERSGQSSDSAELLQTSEHVDVLEKSCEKSSDPASVDLVKEHVQENPCAVEDEKMELLHTEIVCSLDVADVAQKDPLNTPIGESKNVDETELLCTELSIKESGSVVPEKGSEDLEAGGLKLDPDKTYDVSEVDGTVKDEEKMKSLVSQKDPAEVETTSVPQSDPVQHHARSEGQLEIAQVRDPAPTQSLEPTKEVAQEDFPTANIEKEKDSIEKVNSKNEMDLKIAACDAELIDPDTLKADSEQINSVIATVDCPSNTLITNPEHVPVTSKADSGHNDSVQESDCKPVVSVAAKDDPGQVAPAVETSLHENDDASAEHHTKGRDSFVSEEEPTVSKSVVSEETALSKSDAGHLDRVSSGPDSEASHCPRFDTDVPPKELTSIPAAELCEDHTKCTEPAVVPERIDSSMPDHIHDKVESVVNGDGNFDQKQVPSVNDSPEENEFPPSDPVQLCASILQANALSLTFENDADEVSRSKSAKASLPAADIATNLQKDSSAEKDSDAKTKPESDTNVVAQTICGTNPEKDEPSSREKGLGGLLDVPEVAAVNSDPVPVAPELKETEASPSVVENSTAAGEVKSVNEECGSVQINPPISEVRQEAELAKTEVMPSSDLGLPKACPVGEKSAKDDISENVQSLPRGSPSACPNDPKVVKSCEIFHSGARSSLGSGSEEILHAKSAALPSDSLSRKTSQDLPSDRLALPNRENLTTDRVSSSIERKSNDLLRENVTHLATSDSPIKEITPVVRTGVEATNVPVDDLPKTEIHPTNDSCPVEDKEEPAKGSDQDRGPATFLESALPAKAVPEVEALNDAAKSADSAAPTCIRNLTFDYDASAQVSLDPRSLFPLSGAPKTNGRGRKRKKLPSNDDGESTVPREVPILRQSSRIAKLREKEDEERRKLEADRLQRLKEEHERREKRRQDREERMKKMEEKQQRRQQKMTIKDESDQDFDEEEDSSSDEEPKGKVKGKKEKRKKRKRKKQTPWDSSDSSEESSSSEDDGLEDMRVEEENEELIFKSDHEFSPESDLDDEAEELAQPRKHARTARADLPKVRDGRKKIVHKQVIEEDEEEEEEDDEDEDEEEDKDTNCQKCGQSDHPEWILLCDRCDYGWHASCVRPAIMVIPEGNWYCPPCEHGLLMERLNDRLEAYEFLLQEKEAELERRKEQLAKEAVKSPVEEEVEEEEDADNDDGHSGAEEAFDAAAGEGSSETNDEEDDGEDDEEDEGEKESDDSNLDHSHTRRQRKAAKQANYSFKDYDDMIKSALQDPDEDPAEAKEPTSKEEQQEGVVKSLAVTAEEGGTRSAPIGGKRMSTSDDDSDIMPRVIRKKKSRKLNDLSATSNEDDSDEDFQGSASENSESEDDDEEASESDSSFVVDDDSDSDVVVPPVRKSRAASPPIRRSTRNSRKKYSKMLDSSDTSEEESEYEVSSKRKRGHESWDESGDSSSDASWGRSKKRRTANRGRAKPVPVLVPKAKPARKAPTRGRGRGGRNVRADSDDEPFRTNISTKKIKEETRVLKKNDQQDSDHLQRRSTRGRQVSYKEMISSGESQEEDNTAKHSVSNRGSIKRGTGRRGAGSGGWSGDSSATTVAPAAIVSTAVTRTQPESTSFSVVSRGASSLDEESRFSGSTDTLEFTNAAAAAAAAAAVYTTGDDSHISNDILPPNIDPDLVSLPTVIMPEDSAPVVTKDLPILPPEMQVARLIQQSQRSHMPATPQLPVDLQVTRLIGNPQQQPVASPPARNSPILNTAAATRRDLRETVRESALDPDTLTPPPALHVQQPSLPLSSTAIPPDYPMYPGGVIKQARHSLPLTPPLYSTPVPSKVTEARDLMMASSVIRPFPTTATPSALSSVNSSSNPLSIQGLLSTSAPAHPPAIRPYSTTSHMIGHGPFLNHPYNSNPYSVAPPRGGYIGTPVTIGTPRPAYPPMYSPAHVPPPPHGLQLHSPYPPHGAPLRPNSSYQHAGYPQAFAAAAAAAASAEEERRIYRVAQANRQTADSYDTAAAAAAAASGLSLKTGSVGDNEGSQVVGSESEFGGLVSYFSSQQEDFGES